MLPNKTWLVDAS